MDSRCINLLPGIILRHALSNGWLVYADTTEDGLNQSVN